MSAALDEKSTQIARLAITPRYFKVFIENFNRDFHSQLRAGKRIPSTRFNLRRIDGIEDFASGLARYIYSRIDLRDLLPALTKSEVGEEGRAIAKFLNTETPFARLSQEYLERRKLEATFRTSVATAVSDYFFEFFAGALTDTFETIIDDEKKNKDAIREHLERSSLNSPKFEDDGKRIRAIQEYADETFIERKAVVRDRCTKLKKLCISLQNQQPELKRLVEQYDGSLRILRVNRGLYGLLLAGIDIQNFLEIKAELPANEDDNLPLDSTALGATTALLMAHAGLINVYPDVDIIFSQIDRFRAQSKSLDALRERVLDPVLRQLANSKGILDEPTLQLTKHINTIDEKEKISRKVPSQSLTSIKLAWLRGALSAMGRHVLDQGEKVGRIVRDTAVKETVTALVRNPSALSASILAFVALSQPALLRISDTLRTSFGWLRPFLAFVGLI